MLIDIFGTLLSLITTYFLIKLNKLAWPFGIIATILNAWLYWSQGIYADMSLEIFYCLSMGYGWYQWNKQSNQTFQSIRTLTQSEWISIPIVFVLLFTLIYYFLTTYTQSNIAILDALTTALSLIGQWLMCHKVIFTWVIWFFTDLIYALMYVNKQIPFHAGLMLIYTGMAISGYLVWKRVRDSSPTLTTPLRSSHSSA